MALNISKISSADSFLLTFSPLEGSIRDPFSILLDPVLEAPAANSLRLHHHAPPLQHQSQHIPSILNIPTPDLVVISQSRITPPLEAALRHIALTATRTIIFADPAASKTIRTWKNFDVSILRTLSPWQDPRQAVGLDRAARIAVPPCYIGGENGEVTVSLIPHKGVMKCTARPAIGITYHPSPSRPCPFRRSVTTPIVNPKPNTTVIPPLRLPSHAGPSLGVSTTRIVPPTPPDSPILPPVPPKDKDAALPLPPRIHGQTLSVIFSPRGTPYSNLKPYATSHLVSEAALPLTALIHSFDAEPRPIWAPFGGNNMSLPIGQETALALGTKVWVGTNGRDDMKKTRHSRARTFLWHEIQQMLDYAEARDRRPSSNPCAPRSTQILDLDHGEEVTLTSDGIRELGLPWQRQSAEPDALGLFNHVSWF